MKTAINLNGKKVRLADSTPTRWVGDKQYALTPEELAAMSIVPPKKVKHQIADLESTITPRRLRDAVLTDEGRVWLEDVEAQINMLRGQL